MKIRNSIQVALTAGILLASSLVWAAPKPIKVTPQSVPPFPGTLVNARFLYVTSYDGDQFNINLLPEDRQAIATVQDAMQKWGKFTLVYEPQQADIVLMVMSRPSEDVLAVRCARRAGQSVSVAHDGPRRTAAGRISPRHQLRKGFRSSDDQVA